MNVVFAGDAAVADKVLSVLRDSLAREGLDLVTVVMPRMDPLQIVHTPSELPPVGPVVRLWLDLVSPRPTMYLISATSGLVYVRPLSVRANPDTVEIELIRFVVDSSVQAILKGHSLGISRDEFERSLAKTPTPEAPAPAIPAPVPPRRWAAFASYSGTMLSSDLWQQGPQLGAEWRPSHLQLGITLLQDIPLTVTRSEVSTRLISSGLRIFAAVPVAVGAGLLASFGIGGGVDATHVAPEGVGATRPFWVTDPLVGAVTALERTFGRLIASVRVGIDWDLLAARYAVVHSEGTVALWTPQRWRPFADVRVGFAF